MCIRDRSFSKVSKPYDAFQRAWLLSTIPVDVRDLKYLKYEFLGTSVNRH